MNHFNVALDEPSSLQTFAKDEACWLSGRDALTLTGTLEFKRYLRGAFKHTGQSVF